MIEEHALPDDEVLAQQQQRFETERRELQDTIAELRARLEVTVGGGQA